MEMQSIMGVKTRGLFVFPRVGAMLTFGSLTSNACSFFVASEQRIFVVVIVLVVFVWRLVISCSPQPGQMAVDRCRDCTGW